MMQFIAPHSDEEYDRFVQFLRLPVTLNFIEILAHKACLAVRLPPTLSGSVNRSSPPETPSSSFHIGQLHSFIRDLVVGSRVQATTLFGTMVYLERLKWYLPPNAFNRNETPQLALIACLILAGKFLNDSAPKNKHWAHYSKLFQVQELNQIELLVLSYLKFDLSVTNSELLDQYRAFSHLTINSLPPPLLVSPLTAHFPRTPQSAVFPPSVKTPHVSFFPEENSNTNRQPIVLRSPVRSNVTRNCPPLKLVDQGMGTAPYPSPLHTATRPSDISHFPLSKAKRISDLPDSGSRLYRRRFSRKQSQGSSGPPPTKELAHLNPGLRLNPLALTQHPYSADCLSAPLSAPLMSHKGSRFPRSFTVRSNVPQSARLPPPPYTLPSHTITPGQKDPSLKLPPIRLLPLRSPGADRLPRLMEPDIKLGP